MESFAKTKYSSFFSKTRFIHIIILHSPCLDVRTSINQRQHWHHASHDVDHHLSNITVYPPINIKKDFTKFSSGLSNFIFIFINNVTFIIKASLSINLHLGYIHIYIYINHPIYVYISDMIFVIFNFCCCLFLTFFFRFLCIFVFIFLYFAFYICIY